MSVMLQFNIMHKIKIIISRLSYQNTTPLVVNDYSDTAVALLYNDYDQLQSMLSVS